ncbi:DUF1150 domain-containing protein [Aliiroseovarius sp. S1339]|uniref:DUF1150 family protein n=1 Tax=Aliiroseovarius sp. S1339 TaxID=2936990 RepID=UPI0020C050E0|nr:DUF1150 family protein [Aliiroseovarius sp. S1339]MCK8465221.1 DUF1150 domain-containing protein [Aliiroseovarius sp. S1339]
MNHKISFGQFETGNIVYVKAVAIDDLPDAIQDEARAQADGADTLYAVHREDGEQLALVVDRELAYSLARQNDFSPVSIH